jgi:hypothetical protein
MRWYINNSKSNIFHRLLVFEIIVEDRVKTIYIYKSLPKQTKCDMMINNLINIATTQPTTQNKTKQLVWFGIIIGGETTTTPPHHGCHYILNHLQATYLESWFLVCSLILTHLEKMWKTFFLGRQPKRIMQPKTFKSKNNGCVTAPGNPVKIKQGNCGWSYIYDLANMHWLTNIGCFSWNLSKYIMMDYF